MCRGPFIGAVATLHCRSCGLGWMRAGDVHLLRPPFTGGDHGVQPQRRARMRELIADAERDGWQAGLTRFQRDVVGGQLAETGGSVWARARAKVSGGTWEDLLHDVVDPTRAGWKFFLDVRAHSRVLFLGPTWGAAPLALARGVAHVTVLDGSTERLRLVALQASALGIGNLTLACVRNPLRLPVPAASVDLAVVPGLAPWLRATGGQRQGRDAVRRLLTELRRVLAPGGQAWVGTVNGRRPWRLLDPEAAAAAQSAEDLRAAVHAARFAGCRLLALVPFRHKFHQVVDLERSGPAQFSADAYRARGPVVRMFVRAWDACHQAGVVRGQLYRRLPALNAVLSTTHARSSFAERLLRHLVSSGHVEGGAAVTRYYVRPKGVVVVGNAAPGEPGAIVRLPLDERAAGVCAQHHAALAALAADDRLPRALRALFPLPLAHGIFDGHAYFAESALGGESGRRYYTRSRRRYDRAIARTAEMLAALRAATETPVRVDEAEFVRLCGGWLTELRDLLDDGVRPTLDAVEGLLRRALLGATLPLGWQHGDMDFANVLYGRDDDVTGVLDFEVFDARGLPLLDLLFLLARRPIRRHKVTFGTIFTHSILPRRLPPLEGALLAHQMTALGADDRLYLALALCCWLNHLRLRRDTWLVRSPSWLQANLHDVVEHVRRVL